MSRVGVLQLCSSNDVEDNLNRVSAIMQQHQDRGCQLWVLPESFAFMGHTMEQQRDIAEPLGAGPIQQRLAVLAAQHQCWLVAGTVPILAGDKVNAGSLVFDEQGQRCAAYNKIHLFDADVPGKRESYRESAVYSAGDQLCVLPTAVGQAGISVCYDMRFPELYRQQLNLGAELFILSAAFTQSTGEAHWHTLLRARAIENQCYILASAQQGEHVNGRKTYGHSLIYDPWGELLAELPEGDGAVFADIDLQHLRDIRRQFPCLDHRTL